MRQDMKKRRMLMHAVILTSSIFISFGSRAEETETLKEQTVSSDKVQVIRIWEYDRGTEAFVQTLEELADRAETELGTENNLRVIAQAIPEEEYAQKVMDAYIRNEAPDIVFGSPHARALFLSPGAVIDLSPLIDQWEMEDSELLEDISSLAWEYFKNGKLQTGLPLTQKGTGIVYNKALFDKAGISKLPADYEEWYEACEKLLLSGVIPWISGTDIVGSPDVEGILYWLGTNRASFLTEIPRADFGNDTCMAVWEFLLENRNKGYEPADLLLFSDETAWDYFLEGKAAMYRGELPVISEGLQEQFGVLPMIAGPLSEGRPIHPVSYEGYYCLRSAHNQESLRVLKWWYEHADALCAIPFGERVPCRKSIAAAVWPVGTLAGDWIQDNLFSDSTGTYFYPQTECPVYAHELLASGYLSDLLSTVYSGGNVEEGVEKVNYEVNRLLDRYLPQQ